MAETAGKGTSTGAGKRKSAGGSADGESGGGATATAGNGSAGAVGAEARSRFTSALEEARAGVAALGSEARERATDYGSQARTKGSDYAGQAKARAGELAVEGKARASEAISGLAKLVGDNAETIDERLGGKYGEYARSASQSLQDAASRLDEKSVEELTEDAREFVRKSPGTAVAMAAAAGFLFARLVRGK